MNNEDMSDMIQKLSNMINNSNNNDITDNSENKDISSNLNDINFENLQNILSNMNLNENNNNDNNNDNNNIQDNSNNFNLDFETIMKMKRAIDIFNSSKNSPETNLLLSLKPYLNNNRKQKLDQYMQFLNLSKIIETFNFNGGVNKNDFSE